jgi:ATP-dependent Lon protease
MSKSKQQPQDDEASLGRLANECKVVFRKLDEVVEAAAAEKVATAATAAAAVDDGDDRDDSDDSEPASPGEPAAPSIDIYSYDDLRRYIASTRRTNTDDDTRRRNAALATMLAERGCSRELQRLPDDWNRLLNELQADFPHAGEFFETIRNACALAAQDDGVVHLPNLNLVGPPGSGKSALPPLVDGIVGGGFVRVSMSAIESGAMLGGSQETWSNSKPGLVFVTLTEGRYGNPIVMLDELDKNSADTRYDPMGPLYTLLEPNQAKHFVDLSVPMLPLNTSRVVWIATSNDPDFIPAPIRQRLVEIEIPLPTPAQSPAILRSVMRWLQRDNPRLRRFVLDDSAQQALLGLAPRQMRKLIVLGCGRAARHGRTVLTLADIPHAAAQRRRMGF